MGDDCVSRDEMRRNGLRPDPIDAVLHGDGEGDDLLDVATVVHDLRSAYLRPAPLARGPELTAYTGVSLTTDPDPTEDLAGFLGSGGDEPEPPPRRKRRSMIAGLSGFAGTVAGKVTLAAAATAASVGGLHAADVVDVPVLPDAASSGASTSSSTGPSGDASNSRPDSTAGGAGEGRETADDNRSAAESYTAAVQEWTDCVAGAAAGQGEAETRTTGGFDPRDDCGEHPRPEDFGVKDLPASAADAATEAPRSPEGAPGDPAGAGSRGNGASSGADAEAPPAQDGADASETGPGAREAPGRPETKSPAGGAGGSPGGRR